MPPFFKRNQDSPQEVERRFKAFDNDITHWVDYDYVIINQNLENCYKQIEQIILKEHVCSQYQIWA